ncbi:MAG: N-acetyltransferase family protein, partial [Bacteroidia bacterium]|nr:N-acetyltransferase family protein [Bacteroidia bacterium]
KTYNATVAGRMVTADLEPVSVESKKKWFDEHSENFRPLLVVEADGMYAGWLSFNSFYGRPAYNGTAEVSIYLEENFHSKGLGKICLQKSIEICPTIKVHTLLGFIFGHNERSLQLFYKMGFEKWAHLPKVAMMDDVERDLLILGKRIF